MDSLTIFALCHELNDALQGARIDKIHQPSDREIVLTLRSRSGTHRLLLSANRAQPRAHFLYAVRPVNPEEPPMFCMLLRRRLEGARVLGVRQLGRDRIVVIDVEATNDLGDRVTYGLILEVMGKHSNLMLCEIGVDGTPGRITDSLIHVSPDLSRVRPVLPGFQYTPVPPQAKTAVSNVTAETLRDIETMDDKTRVKHLTRTVEGVGPLTAREALSRAGSVTPPSSEDFAGAVAGALKALNQAVHAGEESPYLEYDGLGRPIAVAPFHLTCVERTGPAESLNRGLDALYEATVEIRQTSRLASDLTKSVADSLDKLRGKLTKISRQLEESASHESLRIQGELLTTYMHEVSKGATQVTLPDYYHDDQPIAITLDPALSPIENAQRYFKQSSKRKRSIPILTRERDETLSDIDYLEAVAVHLQDATPTHLTAIRDELTRQGFFRKKQAAGSKSSKRDKREGAGRDSAPLPPDAYVSSEGFTIRVGRNNLQNDRLTLRSSQQNDVWLHVKDQPGSHVVIQTERQEVPEATLHEAALLAAYFSKGRDSANVPVDYTLIRHIWKPNGARPGHVLYDNQKTLYVTPDRAHVQAVLARQA